MKLKGVDFSFKQLFCLMLYYSIAYYLPQSNTIWGKLMFAKKIRYNLCRGIFRYLGKNVNIERRANFGSGRNIEIGDYSGIGINSVIPGNTKIGSYVMMGPNCYILGQNHRFDDLEIPMMKQGYVKGERTVIEDNVWIGRDVTFTPGRHIKYGSVIGACCLLCKDFPENSIIGGNPSKLIRVRK